MSKHYSDQELETKFAKRERSLIRSLDGARQHELLFELYNITPTEYRTLSILMFAGGEAAPSFIADALHVLRQTMTKVVDSLEQKALVVRAEHPTDRRRVHVKLLPAGEKMARELLELETEYNDRVTEHFEPGEMDTYRRLFKKLHEARDEVLQSILEERKSSAAH